MTDTIIWCKGQKYYLFDKYDQWKKAYNIAKYYQKKNKKCRHIIMKVKTMGLFSSPYKFYLYLNKVQRLW